ncbi:hypothetical protein HOD20_06385, partial [archaeon]|nr:hypothetical protein [archaeon]
IARMDADDISKKDRFKEQVNFLNNYPNAALVGSQAEIISEDGKYLYISELPHSKEKITEYLKTASPFFHGSVMIRKEILINVGCYDENVIHFVEDLILWKRLNLNNDMYNINKPLYKYRLRYNALSNRPKNLELKMVRLCDLITSEDQTDKLQYHYNELNNLFKKIKKISKKKLQSLYYQKLGRIYLTKNIHLSEAKINLNKSIQYSIFNLHAYYYILIYYIKKIKDSK